MKRSRNILEKPLSLWRLIGLFAVAAVACGVVDCKPPRIEEFTEQIPGSDGVTANEQGAVEDELQVLAAVDDDFITLAEFQRRLRQLPPLDQRRVSSEGARRQLLDAMIHMHMFAAEAEATGLANDPAVVQSERAALREVVLDRLVGPDVSQPSEISDEDVRRVYDAESFRYQRPELARVGLIITPTRADAVDVVTAFRRRLDLDIRTSMELFERLAAEHSIAPPEAAHLGFVSRSELGEVSSSDVVEAVFELINAGQSTDPIPVAGGQAVFYLIERRRDFDRGVDEVAEMIREQIVDRQRRDAAAETVERLRESADVEIDRNLLQQLATTSGFRHPPIHRRAWESLSDVELDHEMTPRRDLSFLGDLLRPPQEGPPAGEGTDGDEGE